MKEKEFNLSEKHFLERLESECEKDCKRRLKIKKEYVKEQIIMMLKDFIENIRDL